MAAITAGAIALGLLSGSPSIAAPSGSSPDAAGDSVPAGLGDSFAGGIRSREAKSRPTHFLLKLEAAPTSRTFRRNRADGVASARRAARGQLDRIEGLQELSLIHI